MNRGCMHCVSSVHLAMHVRSKLSQVTYWRTCRGLCIQPARAHSLSIVSCLPMITQAEHSLAHVALQAALQQESPRAGEAMLRSAAGSGSGCLCMLMEGLAPPGVATGPHREPGAQKP